MKAGEQVRKTVHRMVEWARGWVGHGEAEQQKSAPESPAAIRRRNMNGARKADTRPPGMKIDVPRYPSYMDGLPPVRGRDVMATQRELLDKIRDNFDANNEEQRKVFEIALIRYAEIVHLLPASETDHHAQPGGLFRHGLEVALIALKATNGHAPFARAEYPERRKELNVRFRYAVMVAALCHDLGKPITDINVTDASGEHRWNPFAATIPLWAEKNGVDSYFVYWNRGRHRRHEPASLTLLAAVMGAKGREFLVDYPSQLFNETLECVSGNASSLNLVAKIVKEADSSSTAADKKQTVNVYGGTGIPVERYYLSAIRRLVKNRRWKPNTPGSPFWVIDRTPFLVWPAAGEAVAGLLKEDGVRGIPLDPETIARELLDRSLATAFVDDDNEAHTLWPIAPDALKGKLPGKSARLKALRLSSIDTLTDEFVESTPGRFGSATRNEPDTPKPEPGNAPEADAVAGAPAPAGARPAAPDAPEVATASDAGAPPTSTAPVPAEEAKTTTPVAPAPPPQVASGKPKPTTGSRLAPSKAPKVPKNEPPRKVEGVNRAAMSAAEAKAYLSGKGFLGQVLLAFAGDLNKLRSASPDIVTVPYPIVDEQGNPIEGKEARIVALRAPDFFADYHPDTDFMRECAERSDLFLRNAAAELPFAVDEDGAEWWRLNDEASRAVLAQAASYRRMIQRKVEAGEPGAKPKPTPSRILEERVPPKPDRVAAAEKPQEAPHPQGPAVGAKPKKDDAGQRAIAGEGADEQVGPEEQGGRSKGKPKEKANAVAALPPMMLGGKSVPDRAMGAKKPKENSRQPSKPEAEGEKAPAQASRAMPKDLDEATASPPEPPSSPALAAREGGEPRRGRKAPKGQQKQKSGVQRESAKKGGGNPPEAASQRWELEDPAPRKGGGGRSVPTDGPEPRNRVIPMGEHTIRVQEFEAPGESGPAPAPAVPLPEMTVKEGAEPESDKGAETDPKARLEARLKGWLINRWEAGLVTFVEKELLEELSAAEKRRVRIHEVRTLIHKYGVLMERLDQGPGFRITAKVIKRLKADREVAQDVIEP